MRIFVTGDFTRPKYKEKNPESSIQNGNIDWIKSVLALSGFDPAALSAVTWNGSGVSADVPAIYAAQKLQLGTKGWIALYNHECSPAGAEALKDTFEPADLIMGFELSPFQQSAFRALNKPYLSLSVAPERFATDYIWQFESNIPGVEENIRGLSLTHAQLVAAADIRKRRAKKLKYAPGAVIFGQIAADASLLYREKVLTLQDFVSQIRTLKEEYGHIYYKRHPFTGGDEDIVDMMIEEMGVTGIQEDPYDILTSDCFPAVAAISSSIVHEAGYFGKQAFFLARMKKLKGIYPDRTFFGHVPGVAMTQPGFWQKVFAGTAFAKDLPVHNVGQGLAYSLRDLLPQTWDVPKSQLAEWHLHAHVQTDEMLDLQSGYAADAWGPDWQFEEGFGCWSRAPNPSLRLRFNKQPRGHVSISFPKYEVYMGKNPERFMEVHVNGTFIKHFHFTRRDPLVPIFLTIPTKHLVLGRYMKIDFVFNDIRRPVYYEESGDRRPLGINLRSMYISTAPFERRIEKAPEATPAAALAEAEA